MFDNNKKIPRGVFRNAIISIMFACGGDHEPFQGTIDLIEELALNFIEKLLQKSLKLTNSSALGWKSVLVVLQKDAYSFARAKELIGLREFFYSSIRDAGREKKVNY